MTTHAQDRLYERFGIVFGAEERRDVHRALASRRFWERLIDGNGRRHVLVELDGPRQKEVIEIVLAPDNFIVTALVPGPSATRSFRALFPERPHASAGIEVELPPQSMLEVWRCSIGAKMSDVAAAVGITKRMLGQYEGGVPCPPDTFRDLVAVLRHRSGSRVEAISARDRILDAIRARTGQKSKERATA